MKTKTTMDIKQFVGKFLEQDKITDAVLLEEKTTKGKEVIKLIFEGGKERIITQEVAVIQISDEPKDATAVREDLMKVMVAEMLAVLLERRIKINDIDYLFLKLNESINLTLKMANDKLWGKTSDEKTLDDVEKILIEKK
jgi:hypothetical protein